MGFMILEAMREKIIGRHSNEFLITGFILNWFKRWPNKKINYEWGFSY